MISLADCIPSTERLRRAPRSLAMGLVWLVACSGQEDDPKLRDSTRQVERPLEITDPAIALEVLLPEVPDPAFEGLVPSEDAAEKGMWSAVFSWPMNGLHSTLLPDGRVLTYGTPSGAPGTQDGRTFDIWDPSEGFGPLSHETDYDAQRVNSFCSSAAFAADGTLLISGGNSPIDSSVFSPLSGGVETSPHQLASQRWYASMITLADGRLLILGGSAPYAALRAFEDPVGAINAGTIAMTPEIYELGSGFRSLFGASSREAFGPDYHRYWYPRAWVAPDGGVFGISSEKMWKLDPSGDGSVEVAGNFKTGVDSVTKPNIGPTSTAVMFAPGRILQVGGNGYYDSQDTPSSAQATIIDINGEAPEIIETASMQFGRQWANATVLPTGQVVVTGGTARANNGGADAVKTAEIWDPESGLWNTGAAAAVIRVYHSAAILLPNGTILSTGGGAPGPVNNLNAELFYPPSLFRAAPGSGSELAPRPRAVAISTTSPDYGEVVDVDLADSPDIFRVALVATSATTHSFNTSQRRMELSFVQEGGRLAVRMPLSGTAAPPGYYLLFLIDEAGVPSRGVVLALGEGMAAPPTVPTLPRGAAVIFESVDSPGHQMAINEGELGVLEERGEEPSEEDLERARLVLHDGLADPTCVSFESSIEPGKWLVPVDFRLGLAVDNGSFEFAETATYCVEAGLAGTGVSFRSLSEPERVVRHRDSELWLDLAEVDEEFWGSASFVVWHEPLPVLSAVTAPVATAGADVVHELTSPIAGARYSWDFGDGSEPTLESNSPSVVHAYDAPGIYLVTLTVRLADGRRVKKTFVQAVGTQPLGGPAQVSSRIAVSDDSRGERIWVVNPDNDSVTVFDAATLSALAEVEVGEEPDAIAFAGDGAAWVTVGKPASIAVIDPDSLLLVDGVMFPQASRPRGIVSSPATSHAYVTLEGLGRLVQISTTTKEVEQSLDLDSAPRGLAASPDGARLWISQFISSPAPLEETTSPDLDEAVGRVFVVDIPAMTNLRSAELAHSHVTDSSVGGRGLPNYLGAPAPTPDGSSVWIPSKQDNIARGQSRDGQELDFQNSVRAVVSRLDAGSESESEASPRVDLDNAGLATAVLFHPLGIYAFVALETSREVAVVGTLLGTELFRFSVGRAPHGLALSADGMRLFVHNFMDRSLSVVDLTPLLVHGEFNAPVNTTVNTVTDETLEPTILLGKQLFYDAADPRLARDGYLSCASCHADGTHDGRVWDLSHLGEGLRNSISLRGMNVRTGPLHFSGNFDEVQDFEGQIRELSAGTGLLSDDAYLSGTISEPLGDAKAGLSPELDALAAYVSSLSARDSPYRPGEERSELSTMGRMFFSQVGCSDCHYGASFSDEKNHERMDVGTLTAASGQRLFQPLDGIDVPSLVGVWETAPYLHDGSALTLSDAIEAHEGVALSNEARDAIVAFLLELDGREPPIESKPDGDPDEPDGDPDEPDTPPGEEEPDPDPSPTGSGGAPSLDGDSAAGAPAGGDLAKNSRDDPSGCSCRSSASRTAPTSGALWLIGAGVLLLLRRRWLGYS